MAHAVDPIATTVVPVRSGTESELAASDTDDFLRELAGAPPQIPSVVHLLGAGAIIGGKYRIEEKIGAGGMGAVFRAADLRLQRTVAIKVHHGRATSVERLRREARTLARLSHPNVVTVLEVGDYEGAPFVAMAYVKGGSARTWARQPGRTWREVLEIYVQAARGLAAAHAIGIIHRDFKPDNLLVGDGPRAMIADFGLADERAHDDDLLESLERVGISTESNRTDMTEAGVLVGTPAYVAPEQIRSSRVDARADQFSFFAALYEGLYGELPFPGTTANAVLGRILEGDLAEPIDRHGVPRWLHAVIRRGLSLQPKQRYADMDAARAALGGPRSRRGIATVVVALGLAGAGWLATDEPDTDPRCDADPSLAVDARRAQISARFADADAGLRETWARLDRRLVSRGQGHTAAWVTACAAQREGATPAAIATMRDRLACLDDAQGLTSATLDELEGADAGALARLLDASTAWPDPLSCITATPPAPTTSEGAPGEPDLVRELLQQSRAAAGSGHVVAASTLAAIALAQAQAVGDDALIARALLARGVSRLSAGQHAKGIDDATSAFTLAERVGDEETLRDASVLLANAYRDSPGESAMQWVTQARRHLHRWPDDAGKQVQLLLIEAEIEAEHLRFEAATTLIDEAESIATQAQLSGSATAQVWLGHAVVSEHQGEYGTAIGHAERARELLEAEFGADHYRVGRAWSELGFIYESAGNYPEARRHLRRALALYESPGGGPDGKSVVASIQLASLETLLGNSDQALIDLDRAEAWMRSLELDIPVLDGAVQEARGNALLDLGRFEEALVEFEAVIRLREAHWGTAHTQLRAPLLSVALAARSLGRTALAEDALARAVRIQDDVAHDDLLASDVYHGYGFSLLDTGDVEGAARQFERAEQALQRAFGDDHPDHGWPALGLGRVALRRGDPAAALPWFERAAASWSDPDADKQPRAELALSHAEALRQLGRRDEAIAIARAGLALRPGHEALRAWLDEHAPGAAAPR